VASTTFSAALAAIHGQRGLTECQPEAQDQIGAPYRPAGDRFGAQPKDRRRAFGGRQERNTDHQGGRRDHVT